MIDAQEANIVEGMGRAVTREPVEFSEVSMRRCHQCSTSLLVGVKEVVTVQTQDVKAVLLRDLDKEEKVEQCVGILLADVS